MYRLTHGVFGLKRNAASHSAGNTAASQAKGAALFTALLAAVLVAGCAGGPGKTSSDGRGSRGQRDGPPGTPPANAAQMPDAQPRLEPLRSGGPNKPYMVLGRAYTPLTTDSPLIERGLASWYGRQFHGRPTASGEPYDMYAMTAAHTTMPLPSYARVRNPANGREIIVRVNDRGPFHAGRVVDLSYSAAAKLDLLRGVAPVEIERITFDEIRAGTWRRDDDNNDLTAALAVANLNPDRQAVRSKSLPRKKSARPADDAAPGIAVATATNTTATAETAPVETTATASALAAVPSILLQPTSSVTELFATSLDAAPSALDAPAVSMAAAFHPDAAKSGLTTNTLTGTATGIPQSELTGAAAATTTATAGFWVQLGAFSQHEGAIRFKQQMASQFNNLALLLEVLADRASYKVQAGPFATRDAARNASDAVRSQGALAPLVVERR